MISKEKFVEIINRLKDYNDLQDKIQNLFRDNIDNQEMDFMNAGSICVGHESVVVELLKDMFDDKYDYISYYLYECNYGRKTENKIFDNDNKPIDISTPTKFYDFLIENMEMEENEDD